MKKNQKQNLNNIRQIKEAEYGNFEDALTGIGKIWSVLLGLKEPIPGWLVSVMYVAAKLFRTKKNFKEDTYLDAENYLYQAKLMQEKDAHIYRDWVTGYNKWKKEKNDG